MINVKTYNFTGMSIVTSDSVFSTAKWYLSPKF